MTITQFFHGWKAGELSNLFVRECWTKTKEFILENKKTAVMEKIIFKFFCDETPTCIYIEYNSSISMLCSISQISTL